MLAAPGALIARGRRGLPALRLVDPGAVWDPLALTRAQLAGVQSSAIGADGATLALFGADTARFNGTARRLLIEGQRTNAIRNPRAEGAVAGTPGTLPTNWAIGGFVGLTQSVIGVGVDLGIPYVDIRFSGTSGGTFGVIFLEASQVIAAANGQQWSCAAFVRLVGGSWANTSGHAISIRQQDSGGGGLGDLTGASSAPPAVWFRQLVAATTNNASVAFVRPFFRLDITNGSAVDFTLRIGAPQLEQGAFASSAILPPVGTPGASTRGADLVSASLSSLGIGASGACTVLWSGMIPQAASSGANQAILHVVESVNNRWLLRNQAGGSNIQWLTQVAGNTTGAATVGTMTAGTPFRLGAVIRGDGSGAVSVNGAAAVSISGGPTSGLNTLIFGSALSADAMHGETTLLRVLPYTLSDTDLAAAVAALPT